jgi:hypothetical protein
MIQRYLIALLLSLALCTSASAAVKATTIQFLLNQQRSSTGSLAGGTVECYASGTSTLKTIWLDRDKADEAANPYTLDSNGTAPLFGDGVYRIVLKDAAGNVKYDRSGLMFQDDAMNADTVDNFHAAATPTANKIAVFNSSAKIPGSAISSPATDSATDVGTAMQLRWNLLGSLHTIDDDSQDTLFGGGIEADTPWQSGYPMLVGRSTSAPSTTYGVKVDRARYAETLEGKKWVSVVSGSEAIAAGGTAFISLRAAPSNRMYTLSAYNTLGGAGGIMTEGQNPTYPYAYIVRKTEGADYLHIANPLGVGATVAYQVWTWE